MLRWLQTRGEKKYVYLRKIRSNEWIRHLLYLELGRGFIQCRPELEEHPRLAWASKLEDWSLEPEATEPRASLGGGRGRDRPNEADSCLTPAATIILYSFFVQKRKRIDLVLLNLYILLYTQKQIENFKINRKLKIGN